MHDSNPEGLKVQYDTSLYREVRELQRYTLNRVTYTTHDEGLMKDVGTPVNKKFVVWGKVRNIKRFEFDRIAGIFDDGSLIFEFRQSMGSTIPQVKDKLELHGVKARQPRMRYLVKEVLPSLSIMIGRTLISPIGNEGAPEGT